MDDLLLRVEKETAGQSWRKPGETIVAAVSGGPDSMALLHMLKELSERDGFLVVAAHVNHRFRGAEADGEEATVRQVAEGWGIVCETAAIDVPAYIAATGKNPQSAAREKRYEFLREVARRRGAGTIALGHHADDQAETVLMRILRGTGIGGMAGIPERRREKELELIRPLLRITKHELLEYGARNGIPHVVDSSNAKTHYFRNAVRLDILPMLEKYNPRLRPALIRLSELASAENDFMEAEARKALERTAERRGDGWTIDRRGFRGLHVALQRRLIKLILSCLENENEPADFERVEEAAAAISSERTTGCRIDLGRGWTVLCEYESAFIGCAPALTSGFSYSVSGPGTDAAVPEAETLFRFRWFTGSSTSPAEFRREAFFDAADLRFPLTIRSRLPGDRLEPHGLKGSKKVQDMFVDAKVPRLRRDSVPLLADADGRILWIPGLRRSRHAVPNDATAATVRVTAESLRDNRE
ncbi:tRNA lysidine(34) synthetase TilS [Cohnella algarum]|uniref:tRNA lysidine(34) synthetase TilS n=1 Tax=Cohnella algarum TaxID=2044859 RepID=UPI001966F5E4|nr:tRNA lysidine(34) synthetase TilS [Cohnella algarum]MBN2981258.1 tRNA lysidine(34) synthetase TilS [Cohnella algarum]